MEAQRLEIYNLFIELQQAKAEVATLKEAQMHQPMPTQQSQHFSRGASTSTSKPIQEEPTPSTTPLEPIPMEIDQGLDLIAKNLISTRF